MIALLGRKDHPTDGVEDYCNMLRQALAARGYELELFRVTWATEGRRRSLCRLWQRLRGQQGQWVLVQYTALSWSRRGFPWLFVLVLWLLRSRKMRIAVVFHDSVPYHGLRLVDRVRRNCQRFVMHCAYRLTHKAILTRPVEQASWLPQAPSKASFIPVGANIPLITSDRQLRNGHEAKTIAVFTVTGNGAVGNEVSDIAMAANAAAAHIPGIRLITFGRGSAESEPRLRRALEGSLVEYSALGILPAEEVSRLLANADVSLFVRGPISTQRGSAIASIACGVPLVAYTDGDLPFPFCEGGVVGVPYGNREALAEATLRVLSDAQFWLDLHQHSQAPFEKYFSWAAIADRFVKVLGDA